MNEAYEYFTKLGKKELIRSMLKRLAGMYFEQGKFDQLGRDLPPPDPRRPAVRRQPGVPGRDHQAYKKIGQRERSLEEIDRLCATTVRNSAWARANASNPNAVKEAPSGDRENLLSAGSPRVPQRPARKLEKSRHADANKVYEPRGNGLRHLPERVPRRRARLRRALRVRRAALQDKDYAGAFDQYMASSISDPKGKHSKFCAESAIFAAEEQVKLEGGGRRHGQGHDQGDHEGRSRRSSPSGSSGGRRLPQYAELYPDDKKVIRT